MSQIAQMLRVLFHGLIFLLLTVLSQVGGLAWLIAVLFRRRLVVFGLAYGVLSISALWMAPWLGREPLPCRSGGHMQMQSTLYCALNRHYVVADLHEVLRDYSDAMARDFPGTKTRVLDASFPYLTGFPLLPHLSHDDGRKVDLAFYYEGAEGYLSGGARSPLGYFAFEPGPTTCPDNALTLRWNMSWLQGLWPEYRPEPARMKAGLDWLSSDPRVGKIFIEPHLKQRYGITSPKVRFQGCRAARHDDHIHIQL